MEAVRSRVSTAAAGFSTAQKATMAGVAVVVVVLLWAFTSSMGQADMTVLFSDLEPSDAAQVVERLEAEGVEYELVQEGRTIRVPREQVYQLRLSMSADGVPSGGSDGYSILDNQGITTSEFKQRVGYQRALEGELEKTIGSIGAVDHATVHLVMPRTDLFAGDEVQATASVLVDTGAGTLDATQVQAITNLVASSVEGLSPDQVTVADANGMVLAAPGQSAADVAGGNAQMSRTAEFETKMSADLQRLLTTVVGPGKAAVTVNAVLDFDEANRVVETYEPAPPVGPEGAQTPLVTNETVKNEQYVGGGDGAAGVLGPDSVPTPGDDTDTQYRLDEAQRNYAVNRVVEEIRAAPGSVEKLSVAVLVDEEAVSATEMAQIEEVVAAAAGIDVERGDSVAVSRIAFDTSVADQAAEERAAAEEAEDRESMMGLVRIAAVALLVLVVLFLAWRSIKKSSGRRVVVSQPIPVGPPAADGLPGGYAALGGASSPAAVALAEDDAELARHVEAQIAEMIEQQPEQVAQLLKGWLGEGKEQPR